jgi:hypothetical protein
VTERFPRKAGVFGIGPEDSSLKMALDEMHVALALYMVHIHGCDQPYAITHTSLRFIFLCNQCFMLG